MNLSTPIDMLLRMVGRSRHLVVQENLAGHYRRAFQTPSGKEVLGDLARFCNVYRTTHQHPSSPEFPMGDPRIPIDPLEAAKAEGRREVALRILEYSDLNIGDLVELAGRLQHKQQAAIDREMTQ